MAFRRKHQRSRNERGNAVVEAAMVMVPLCLIVFGILEMGFVFKDTLTLGNATRAGARQASVDSAQTNANFYKDTIAAVDRQSAALSLTNGDKLCIYKVNATTNVNGNPGSNSNWCTGNADQEYTWTGTTFSGGNPGTQWPDGSDRGICTVETGALDSVGVALQVDHHSITGIVPGAHITMHEHTVMRLEPQLDCSS